MSPKFILLDEPFAGIDPIAVTDIRKSSSIFAIADRRAHHRSQRSRDPAHHRPRKSSAARSSRAGRLT
jgi:hypothetical protein